MKTKWEKNLDSLARKFIKQKYKGNLTKDMKYGCRMENYARPAFEEKGGWKFIKVGLVVTLQKPFLAYSPDGIVVVEGTYESLEIKCPSTCEDKLIINKYTKEVYPKFLYFDDDSNVLLKKERTYYTLRKKYSRHDQRS